MNASLTPRSDFMPDNAGDSDSDANSDGVPEYYQPISSIDYDDEHGNEILSNGHDYRGEAMIDGEEGENVVEAEEEEERRREESEMAIRRAFEEDESRRNAPLAPENALRVLQAMRGVSFGGDAPDWAHEVPEDRWIEQLRQLSVSPDSAA